MSIANKLKNMSSKKVTVLFFYYIFRYGDCHYFPIKDLLQNYKKKMIYLLNIKYNNLLTIFIKY